MASGKGATFRSSVLPSNADGWYLTLCGKPVTRSSVGVSPALGGAQDEGGFPLTLATESGGVVLANTTFTFQNDNGTDTDIQGACIHSNGTAYPTDLEQVKYAVQFVKTITGSGGTLTIDITRITEV